MKRVDMDETQTVIMIGVDTAAKGGVSSVIRMYKDAGLFQKVRFIPSYSDGGMVRRLLLYWLCLMRLTLLCMTQPSVRVVHIHTSSYGSFLRKSLLILLAKRFGKKTIIHMHGAGFNVFYEKMPSLTQAMIRYVLRSSDVLIALSYQWKRDLYRISKHPDIRVMYNPTVMREPVFQDIEPSPKPEFGRNIRFLFMGRLGQRKGVYDIVESARQLRSGNIQISLYGDGEAQAIQAKVSQIGLSDKILVGGWIDGYQKDEVFRQADVLLLPSYHEGLPISVLEAMAYGLPVVATDVGGISEAVQDGVNGYLIQPGECIQLAERMDRLANSAELRLNMGKSGYELAANKFSLPVIMEQLESLYAELAG
jgi:glycosyltransferase involved in cell wall biosynthesis